MTEPLLLRLRARENSLRSMFTLGSDGTRLGGVGDLFGKFGGNKALRFAESVRLLKPGGIGTSNVHKAEGFAHNLASQLKAGMSLIHFQRPTGGASIYPKLEEILAPVEGQAAATKPSEGELRAGMTIPRMSPFPKPGQSFEDFKRDVQAKNETTPPRMVESPAKPSAEHTRPKPKPELPRQQGKIFSKVQEMPVRQAKRITEASEDLPEMDSQALTHSVEPEAKAAEVQEPKLEALPPEREILPKTKTLEAPPAAKGSEGKIQRQIDTAPSRVAKVKDEPPALIAKPTAKQKEPQKQPTILPFKAPRKASQPQEVEGRTLPKIEQTRKTNENVLQAPRVERFEEPASPKPGAEALSPTELSSDAKAIKASEPKPVEQQAASRIEIVRTITPLAKTEEPNRPLVNREDAPKALPRTEKPKPAERSLPEVEKRVARPAEEPISGAPKATQRNLTAAPQDPSAEFSALPALPQQEAPRQGLPPLAMPHAPSVVRRQADKPAQSPTQNVALSTVLPSANALSEVGLANNTALVLPRIDPTPLAADTRPIASAQPVVQRIWEEHSEMGASGPSSSSKEDREQPSDKQTEDLEVIAQRVLPLVKRLLEIEVERVGKSVRR